MSGAIDQIKTRRKFIRMLSASPLLASPNFLGGSLSNLLVAGGVTERKFLGWLRSFQQSEEGIFAPDPAFDVLDFEAAARQALATPHFRSPASGLGRRGHG